MKSLKQRLPLVVAIGPQDEDHAECNARIALTRHEWSEDRSQMLQRFADTEGRAEREITLLRDDLRSVHREYAHVEHEAVSLKIIN